MEVDRFHISIVLLKPVATVVLFSVCRGIFHPTATRIPWSVSKPCMVKKDLASFIQRLA